MFLLQLNPFNRVSFAQIVPNSTQLACTRPNITQAPEMRQESSFVFLTGGIVRFFFIEQHKYAFDNAKTGGTLTTSLKNKLNTNFGE